ncbi:MAG: GntR family transcriptional regulator [Bifidobacteriaceae bacterium]|jgi:GntR family transcriptional regulator|nr:GntR family transcriptional regulator [Bifidobacteriaceae bacterium]
MRSRDVVEPLVIDRGAPMPVFRQVAAALQAKIESGAWPVHYRLRTEPELAASLGVSRGTLRKAIEVLTAQGRLAAVRGRGTFVTSPTFETPIASRFATLSEELARQGRTFTSQVVGHEIAPAPAPIAALLDVPSGEAVLRLERVRAGAEGPIAHMVNYVCAALAPGIETVDFASRRLFDYLETDCGLAIAYGQRTITAIAAPSLVADRLTVAHGAPILYLEQVAYLAGGQPIEYSDVWVNPARMRITAVVPRPQLG